MNKEEIEKEAENHLKRVQGIRDAVTMGQLNFDEQSFIKGSFIVNKRSEWRLNFADGATGTKEPLTNRSNTIILTKNFMKSSKRKGTGNEI